MTRAFLGLGSNLGNRRARLREAVEALKPAGVVAVSPVYETEPVGGPDQDPFLNLVVELDTEIGARALLSLCHRIEAAGGRVRDREVRWGPRSLDLDVLWIDGVEVAEPDLQVPHPRMWERRFVLIPLRDLAPDLVGVEAVEQARGEVTRLGPL